MFLALMASVALLFSSGSSIGSASAAVPSAAAPTTPQAIVLQTPSLVGLDLVSYQANQVLPMQLPDLLTQDVPPGDDEYNWALVQFTLPGGGPVIPSAIECGTAVDVIVKGFASGAGTSKSAAYNAAMAQLLGAMPFTCSHCTFPVIYQCKASISPNGGTVTILSMDPIVLPGGGAGFRALLNFNGQWRFACANC